MNKPAMAPSYRAADLTAYVFKMLSATGMQGALAQDSAEVLVEADLLGYGTHGLAMLPSYLDRLAKGVMAKEGALEVVADTGATLSWNAKRLPGAWVMRRAIEALLQRAQQHAVVAMSIANSSHIGCLQAYLPALTEKKLMVILSATNPGIESVAPFGGIDPILTTNPLAVGIPTHGAPILVDLSTSLVTNAAVQTRMDAGEQFASKVLLDNQGRASSDPKVFVSDPPGTILPIGGEDYGYKGFGLGLMVEALSLALPGAGRAMKPDKFTQGVFMQVMDPAKFGGLGYFLREMTELADRCRASRVAPGAPPVRMPGDRALDERERRLRDGVPIEPRVRERLEKLAGAGGPAFPAALEARVAP